MHVFKPMEIFYQEVSNAVMGMLMIYDISSPNSPAKPTFKLTNPQEIFAQNAFHGGAMRCVYKVCGPGNGAQGLQHAPGMPVLAPAKPLTARPPAVYLYRGDRRPR